MRESAWLKDILKSFTYLIEITWLCKKENETSVFTKNLGRKSPYLESIIFSRRGCNIEGRSSAGRLRGSIRDHGGIVPKRLKTRPNKIARGSDYL
jgi:hypothetical protein